MQPDLSKFGVTPLTASRPQRMIISHEGDEGCGKTSLGLDAPGPILVINVDRNLEGIAHRYISAGKQIDELRLNIQKDGTGVELAVGLGSKLALEKATKATSDECIKFHTNEFNKFKQVYDTVLLSGVYRTIIIDGGTDLNELMKLATFGRMEQIPPNLYSVHNAMWSEIFNRAKDQQTTNLILTHKTKDEWKEVASDSGAKSAKPTGRKIVSMWKNLPYVVQARLRLMIEDGVFRFTVQRGVDGPGKLLELSGEKFDLPEEGGWEYVCGLLTGQWEGWD